jgi:hypothetical protein
MKLYAMWALGGLFNAVIASVAVTGASNPITTATFFIVFNIWIARGTM